LLAAQSHAQGKGLSHWSDPEEVVWWDPTEGPSAVFHAVKVYGWTDNAGTPHDNEICTAFAAHGLDCDDEALCPDRGPHGKCSADCDMTTGTGVLDIWDCLCFQMAFVAGSMEACDLDQSTGPGVCDVFDFVAFQRAFSDGCN
jgi:hypothetical protein